MEASRPRGDSKIDAQVADRVVEHPEAPSPRRASHIRLLHVALAIGLVALAFVVRRPGYVLTISFWNDEGWVIDAVRAPLRQLRMITSSTPIGFTFLLWLLPKGGDPERYRLVPAVLGALTAVPAYLLGRRLGRGSVLAEIYAGTLAALGATLAASAVAYHSLKQYPSDGLLAVAIVAGLAALEARWTRRRLAAFAAGCFAAFWFSSTAALVATACFGALGVAAALRRLWPRLREIAVAGAALTLANVLWYLAFVQIGNTSILRSWWGRQKVFVPLDGGAFRFIARRTADQLTRTGIRPWWLVALLVSIACVAFWRARLHAVALAVPVLAVLLVGASTAHAYPLFDERTGLFVTVLLAVFASAGAAAAGVAVLRRRATIPLGLVVAAGLLAILVPSAVKAGRVGIVNERVAQQVDFVRTHWRPGDAVLVNVLADWSFAYYWPDRPVFVRTDRYAVTFMPAFPERPDVVLIRARSRDAVLEGIGALPRNARRVWVVLAHATPEEQNTIMEEGKARWGDVWRPRELPRRPWLIVRPGEPRPA